MKKKIKIILTLVFLIILASLFKSEIKELYLSYFTKSNDSYNNISEIIISGEGCYGECEVFDLLLKRNGDVILRNGNYSKNKGLFSSEINQEKFDTLLNYLRKSNIFNANRLLSISEDDYNHSLSIASDNEIIGSYYYCPVDENLVYDSVFIYAKKIKDNLNNLKEFSFNKPFLNHTYFSSLSNDTLVFELYNSDSFYLLTKIDQFQNSNKEINNGAKLQLQLDLWSQYADLSNRLIHPLEFILNAPYEKDSIATIKEYENELRLYPNYPKLVEYEFPYLKFVLNSDDEKIIFCDDKLESYLRKN